MNARLRRLYADFQKIKDVFTGHQHIEVQVLQGDPPEAYRVTYRVPGLRLDRANNRPVKVGLHVARIDLHAGYPREKPACVMETEAFHPNICPTFICIGDEWAAGETIVDVIIQIGQMLQYQNYNPDSPADRVAGKWAEQNQRLFPIGNIDLYPPDVDIDLEEQPQSGPLRPVRPRPQADPDIELK